MSTARRNTRSKSSKSFKPAQVSSQGFRSLVESATERTTEERALTSADRLRDVLAELKHLNLTGRVKVEKQIPMTGGGYCDVFIGYVRRGSNCDKVAVRQLRTHIIQDFEKMLAKELKIWSALDHPNLLHLYGFSVEGDDFLNFSFISEWMENGTAGKYVKANPNCDVRLLTLGIAEGLAYLHEKNIIHGDMKANNVLISNSTPCQPLICDFGISRAVMTSSSLAATSTLSGNPPGSLRWMARELLVSDPDRPDIILRQSKKTDVWSFGMTVYELLTGQIPFFHISSGQESFVIVNINNGVLPVLPETLLHSLSTLQTVLWKLCRECWESNPDDRPGMEAIVNRLQMDVRSAAWEQMLDIDTDEDLDSYVSDVAANMKHLNITGNVRANPFWSVHGIVADIYEARYLRQTVVSEGTAGRLAVKVYSRFSAKKRNAEELRIWSKLIHKNVLKLLGYIHPKFSSFVRSDGCIALVSKWIELGTARNFVTSHPNNEITFLILGAAEGLAYLHSQGVIHDDVQGSNILIADSGEALLSGFGCARLSSSDAHEKDYKDSIRWMARELVLRITSSSEETDVWSFGMMIVELLINDIPYAECRRDAVVYRKVLEGLTPNIPVYYARWPLLHRCLWDIAEDCWNLTPKLRPAMEDIAVHLKRLMSPGYMHVPQGLEIHSYLKSDNYGFVALSWDVSKPPSSAFLCVDRKRKEKITIQTKELHSRSTHPASTYMRLYMYQPSRNQVSVEVSSSEAVTVEDIMWAIYEYYQQTFDISAVPSRKQRQITSAFGKRCKASHLLGGLDLEREVRAGGIRLVDRLCGEVEFGSLTLVSAKANTWELQLIRPED